MLDQTLKKRTSIPRFEGKSDSSPSLEQLLNREIELYLPQSDIGQAFRYLQTQHVTHPEIPLEELLDLLIGRHPAETWEGKAYRLLRIKAAEIMPAGYRKIPTSAVVESLLRIKRNKRVKPDTLLTYTKNFRRIANQFRYLPIEADPLLDHLDKLTGETGRHKRNEFDRLNMLYKHAVRFFKLPKNPLEGIDRPQITELPIRTLSLEQISLLNTTPKDLTEKAAWELLSGHGWRQVEARRITAGDVRRVANGLIWCWGKERNEWAPILPETLALLLELTANLADEEPVLRSRRIRNGSNHPLGEDGMAQLVGRLSTRAKIYIKGHDLRRTFATLVREASGDESLAMRLIRDKIPGQSDRYINFPKSQLVEALEHYSPLRLIRQKETAPESRRGFSGGDGGGSNS